MWCQDSRCNNGLIDSINFYYCRLVRVSLHTCGGLIDSINFYYCRLWFSVSRLRRV